LLRFIDSEADLDRAIKTLLPLAQAPVLAYAELVKSGTVALLIGLLSHENADIVIDVVEVIHELTDEDVGNEVEDDEDDEGEYTAEGALKLLIEAFVSPYYHVRKKFP
jgi:beta-catenin-like protein 1